MGTVIPPHCLVAPSAFHQKVSRSLRGAPADLVKSPLVVQVFPEVLPDIVGPLGEERAPEVRYPRIRVHVVAIQATRMWVDHEGALPPVDAHQLLGSSGTEHGAGDGARA